MLLWDALLQTDYGEEVIEYRRWLYMEHGLPHCEVYIDIPSHLVFPDRSPWSTWDVWNDMDALQENSTFSSAEIIFVGFSKSR
jgi:hypothetical protein